MSGQAARTFRKAMLGAVSILAIVSTANAADFSVSSESELRSAVLTANSGDRIIFTANITLTTGDLPAVQKNITIDGAGHTLSGNDQYRGLFIGAFSGATQVPVTVAVQNLTITDTKAQGGNGAGGGGGGAGFGGALFVADQANVTVSNVSLNSNAASGGNGGGTSYNGGGGGMGGNGGGPSNGGPNNGSGGGGGLGVGADGGNGTGGQPGQPGIATGAASGGAGSGPSPSAGGADGGGGGSSVGGAAGGGGGVGGGVGSSSGAAGSGGFGGGGGGSFGVPGAGGFGGGGGSTSQGGRFGGAGGFGGGGGTGSAGGGVGGFGGGQGDGGAGSNGGGGGAGMGGAIFVQGGGSLTLTGTLTIDGNSVAGGTGNVNGEAFGSGIFLNGSGALVFDPGSGVTQTITDAIEDEAGVVANGYTAPVGYTPGAWGITKNGDGTLVLSGANAYTGTTTVNAGVLRQGAAGAFALYAAFVVNGGTLDLDQSMAIMSSLSGTGGTVDVGAIGLIVDQDADTTFAGAIAGDGFFEKSGVGTLTLTGMSSIGGEMIVCCGTLDIKGGSFTVGGDTTVVRGLLSVSDAGALIASGALTVNDEMRISGSSSVSATGLTAVEALTGLAASLTISTGGTLESFGGAIIVADPGETADVTVTGAGSTWTLHDPLLQIGDGTGGATSLTIANGGALNMLNPAGMLTLDANAVLRLGDGGSAGTLTAPQIQNDGRIVADFTGQWVVSSAISGDGTLTKSGTGSLILTGANSYTGGTDVTAGTLVLGMSTAAGTGAISLAAGTTLGFANGITVANAIDLGGNVTFNLASGSATASGVLSGSGNITYAGSGTINLTGNNSGYSGTTSVTGTLSVNGVLAGTVNVLAGGTLKGNGTVGPTTVAAGGTIAPGNSIGLLTVNGPLTFATGSIYAVEIDPAGLSDRIAVTGLATLGGATVSVAKAPGTYLPGTVFTILTAQGGISGVFSGPEQDMPFVNLSLTYDPGSVYLNVLRNAVPFPNVAITPNQIATAFGVEALGLDNPVYDAVVTQPSAAGARQAFNALSGEAYASVDTVLQQQSVYVREAVGARLRQSVTAPGVQPLAYANGAGPKTAELAPGLTPTLWGQGYGGWGNSFGNGNAASISNSLGGFLIGADVALGTNARAGMFGGFSQSQFDVDARSSSGSIDNYDLGAYVGAQFGGLALRGGASYTWHDVAMNRSVLFPGFTASTDGGYTTGTTQVFGEAGYDVALGAFAFEPFAGLAYVNVSGATLTEGGGSAAGLSVNLGSMDTLYSTLGVRAATSIQLYGRALTPSVTLGWQHAFGDTTPAATMLFAGGATPFQVSGVPIAEDALLLGAGLSYAFSDIATLGVTYTGQLASSASQNAFTAQFSLKF